MGAYLVLHPAARVVSIIPPLFFLPFRVPAAVFLVIWFLGQFLLAGGQSNIAWEAHAGGFIVGAAYAWMKRDELRRPPPEIPDVRLR
jgi:membrane associated rhomboid family serine protease